MILRDYQIAAIEDARRKIYFERLDRIIIHSGTGTGKTVIGSEITKLAMAKESGVLWLAHRRELIDQGYNKLLDNGIRSSVIMADDERYDPSLKCAIASVPTLVNRKDKPPAKLVIIDECHRAPAASYQKILESYPDAKIIGLTATPCRMNDSGLGDMFQGMVSCPSVAQMMQRINPETGFPYLVSVVVYEPARPDISKVSRGANGDYATSGLSKVYANPVITGSIVKHWMKLGKGRRTVLFASGVEDSKGFVEKFREQGVRAEHLDGTTDTEVRKDMLERLERHHLDIVSNVNCLTEGWDSIGTSCVILARPTRSMGLFLQMCGRALRPGPDKENCLILDHAGCHADHGDIDEERVWDLKAGVKRKRDSMGGDTSPGIVTCRQCYRRFRAGPRACPSCAAVIPVQSRRVKIIDGDLQKRQKQLAIENWKSGLTEEQKKRKFFEWVATARDRKYSDKWPMVTANRVFGHWPPGEWIREARQQ